MRTIGGRLATALGLMLLAPQLAWAVANVAGTVTDTQGNALAGATVKLSDSDVEVKTDDKGRYEIRNVDLKGQREERRTVVVTHPRLDRAERKDVVLEDGKTTRLDFAGLLLALLVGPYTPTPGLGRVAVGPLGQYGHTQLNLGDESETVTVNGSSSTFKGTSAGRDFTLDLGGGAAQGAVGLPGFPVVGNVRANPWINFMVGGAAARIRSESPVAPGSTFDLKTSGVLSGAGANVAFECPDCPYWLGVGYDYWRLDASGRRDPCVPFSSPAVASCSSQVDLTIQAHQFSARVGRTFSNNQVTVYAGPGFTWTRGQNDVRIDRVLAGSGGTTTITNVVDQELKASRVVGIVGVAARIGPGFGMLETRFNDKDVSVLFRLMVGFDLGALLGAR